MTIARATDSLEQGAARLFGAASRRSRVRTIDYIHALGLGVFSLEVPYVSRFGLVVAAATSLPRLTMIRLDGRFWLRFVLLASALWSYYAVAVPLGLFRINDSFALIAMALAAYVAGYASAAIHGDDDSAASFGLVAAIAGGVTFAVLAIANDVVFDAGKRMALSPWDDSVYSAPGLGASGALAMCALPAIIFGDAGRTNRRAILALGLLFVTGLYVNVVLQNRTPFLALAAALVVGAILFVRFPGASASKARRIVFVSVPALAAALALPIGDWISELDVSQRFQTEGLATARYDLWWKIVSEMWDHPAGGRMIRLPEAYAHNLWLDVAWDAGLLPFALLLTFHLTHVLPARDYVRKGSPRATLVIVGTGIALLFTCMAEPVLHMQASFFPLSCYFCGLLLGVTTRRRTRRAAALPV